MQVKLDKAVSVQEKKDDKVQIKQEQKEQKELRKARKLAVKTGDYSNYEAKQPRERGILEIVLPKGVQSTTGCTFANSYSNLDYNCTYFNGLIPFKGMLCLMKNGLRFSASSLIGSKNFDIGFDEVLKIRGRNDIVKGGTIVIETVAINYTFNGFFFRDQTLKEMKRTWREFRRDSHRSSESVALDPAQNRS